MHEDRRADDITHDPIDDRHGVLDITELDHPGRGAARPGELQMVGVQPHDEHLSKDGPFDVDPV